MRFRSPYASHAHALLRRLFHSPVALPATLSSETSLQCHVLRFHANVSQPLIGWRKGNAASNRLCDTMSHRYRYKFSQNCSGNHNRRFVPALRRNHCGFVFMGSGVPGCMTPSCTTMRNPAVFYFILICHQLF